MALTEITSRLAEFSSVQFSSSNERKNGKTQKVETELAHIQIVLEISK